ncbi:hypothetical protein OIU76_007773 [Salix suchowensis]|nr:hypothetical protein OIU76_007773 [Salix suchowensis]
MQNDLDRMKLPGMIQLRIQAAMPILLPSVRCFVSCQPPPVPAAAVASLQPSNAISGFLNGNNSQKNPAPSARSANNISTKSKPLPLPLPLQLDNDTEVDPWTLLEDGTGSGLPSSNTSVIGSSDHANLCASSWLKGAVRCSKSPLREADINFILDFFLECLNPPQQGWLSEAGRGGCWWK